MSDRKPVFISYRRSDEPFAATLLYYKLVEAFGEESVFKDVDSFEPGDDFPARLAQFVEESDVLLAIIGPRWTAAEDELGRRIDNPNDWVRIEIASALAQQKRVVPVLVNGAAMPLAEELPDNLKTMSHKHAFRISADRASAESRGLINSLKNMLAEAERERADAVRKARAESERRAKEEAAKKRAERLRMEQEAKAGPSLSRGVVMAMRAIQNWDHIKSRRNVDEYRDHIARFPDDETTRYAALALDELFWEEVDRTNLDDLESYLDEFPEGSHAEMAAMLSGQIRETVRVEEKSQLAEERLAWAEASIGEDPTEVETFLTKFPNGQFADEARKLLLNFRKRTSRRMVLSVAAGLGAIGVSSLWSPRQSKIPVPQDPIEPSERTGFEWSKHDSAVWSVAFSPDGQKVLSGSLDGTIRSWDLATANEIRRLSTTPSLPVYTVAYLRNGRDVLSGHLDGTMRLWDLKTGGIIREFRGHKRGVNSVATYRNGWTAISSSYDGTLRLWEVFSGKEIRELSGHTGSVLSVDIDTNEVTALSGGSDGTLRLWDVATGAVIRQFRGHHGTVNEVAIVPNRNIAISGSSDKTVRLWNLDTGKTLQVLTGHMQSVLSVAYVPKRFAALSGSLDGTMCLWDLETGHKLGTWLVGSPVFSVALAPDGETVLSGSADGTVALSKLS